MTWIFSYVSHILRDSKQQVLWSNFSFSNYKWFGPHFRLNKIQYHDGDRTLTLQFSLVSHHIFKQRKINVLGTE